MLDEAGLDDARRRLERFAGGTVATSLEPLGELGRSILEFCFGDLYAREVLGERERELLTVAVLTVLPDCGPQLTTHLKAALHVGLSEQELEEIFLQTVPYAGFPRAMNALARLRGLGGAP